MSITLQKAIEVFARGFAFGRSFTAPFLAEKIGGAWVVRDGPRKGGPQRREEWIAAGMPAAKLASLAETHGGERFAICAVRAIDESDATFRADFKRLGYRLLKTEPFFVHDLQRIPTKRGDVALERVKTQTMADRLTAAAGSRQILPEHLADLRTTPIRVYVALDEKEIAGWVRSTTIGAHTWVSNMHVLLSHRRRGIGAALLAKMLRDDRAAGAKASVLLSSHAGALLYPSVGYRQIGELLLFSRAKK